MTVEEKVKSFFSSFEKHSYKKGKIIIRAGEFPKHIFCLEKGSVKQYFISKKGDETVVNIYKPGAFFPMSFAMNNDASIFDFEAATQVDIFIAPHDEVIAFVKQNSDVLYDLLRRVYLGTDGLLLRMAYMMTGNARQRLLTELLIHAKRFGKNEKGKVEITISEKDLATQAGLTRETVSRELRRLKENNLALFSKGVITLPSIAKLEASL